MGFSFRFVRNILASRFLLLCAPMFALLPWGLLWWLNSPHGIAQLNKSITKSLEDSVQGCSLGFRGLEIDPTKRLALYDLEIADAGGTQIFRMPNLVLSWGLRFGILLEIESIHIEADPQVWSCFVSTETQTDTKEPFRWDISSPFAIPLEVNVKKVVLKEKQSDIATARLIASGEIGRLLRIPDFYLGIDTPSYPKVELTGKMSLQEQQLELSSVLLKTQVLLITPITK